MPINGFDTASLLQRMVDAVELVRQRLLKASSALARAGVEYAVVDDNAVATWVATADREAVRNTQDVDILIRRADFEKAKHAFESVGFVHRKVAGIDLFLDHADASPRDAVHLIFAGEYVRPGEPAANPDVSESVDDKDFRVLNLDALVRIKLTAFRDKDRMHVRDLIGVGLVDQPWTNKLPAALAVRLRSLLDTPNG